MRLGGAVNHLLRESGLSNLEKSLGLDLDVNTRSHDAIHEFMFLATLFFPQTLGRSWHSRAAFLLYHQEAFHLAHRSLIEALCASYQVAFTLLRSTLEAVLRGALYEGLAHEESRKSARALDSDKHSRELKRRIEEVLGKHPDYAKGLEDNSAGILDVLEPINTILRLRPKIRTMVTQLDEWGRFKPIEDPVSSIYDRIYRKLSDYVHALPDATDIGARLLTAPEDLFDEYKVMPDKLREHLQLLHEVMDTSMVIMINVLIDGFEDCEDIKAQIQERRNNPCFTRLKLKESTNRLHNLLSK